MRALRGVRQLTSSAVAAISVDAVVVGGGVVGLACARALALAGRDVTLLEAAAATGTGNSSRSSEGTPCRLSSAVAVCAHIPFLVAQSYMPAYTTQRAA
jgi:glycine/D-amino acid oxidase-like deaminating enzyme